MQKLYQTCAYLCIHQISNNSNIRDILHEFHFNIIFYSILVVNLISFYNKHIACPKILHIESFKHTFQVCIREKSLSVWVISSESQYQNKMMHFQDHSHHKFWKNHTMLINLLLLIFIYLSWSNLLFLRSWELQFIKFETQLSRSLFQP